MPPAHRIAKHRSFTADLLAQWTGGHGLGSRLWWGTAGVLNPAAIGYGGGGQDPLTSSSPFTFRLHPGFIIPFASTSKTLGAGV